MRENLFIFGGIRCLQERGERREIEREIIHFLWKKMSEREYLKYFSKMLTSTLVTFLGLTCK